jgi:hypothetical protein
MRGVAAAAWGLLGLLAAWDLAGSPGGRLSGSAALCALAFASAAPALVRFGGNGIGPRAWTWLSRPSPYAAAALMGLSHFVLKIQPGSSLAISAVFLILLLAFVEAAGWARYTSAFGGHVADGVDSSWGRALASRFVPLFAMSLGLATASLALAAGFDGTWTALALAVGLIVTIVLLAKTAARVA